MNPPASTFLNDMRIGYDARRDIDQRLRDLGTSPSPSAQYAAAVAIRDAAQIWVAAASRAMADMPAPADRARQPRLP